MSFLMSCGLSNKVVPVLMIGTGLLTFGPVVSGAIHGAAQPSMDEIVKALAITEEKKEADLQDYSSTRRYILKNAHFKQDAEMLVRMRVDSRGAKVFQVISEHNVEGIAKRVFRKVLEGESEISRSDARHFNKVIPQNYNFQLLGTEMHAGRRCYVLAIKAKTRNKYLLDGRIWVDSVDYQITRMEGRTAASMSFWVGKPYVVYDFQKVGCYWLAVRNQSRTDAKFLGDTDFTVEVQNYELQRGREQKVALENLPRLRSLKALDE